MILLEDTRQQAQKHKAKHKWFAENGVEVVRTKLVVGDYSLPTDQSVCIDTKAGQMIVKLLAAGKTMDGERHG